jgi:hypothetical protein
MRAILFSFLISAQAIADANVDKVLEGAGTSGAIATGETYGRNYLNQHVTELPGVGNVSNVGTGIMFGVGMILAGVEYGNAKDDKGRLFATLDAAVTVVALVNPVAGLIAAAGALVVRLVDGILGAAGQSALLQIYKEIAEHLRRIQEIREMRARSEFEIFKSAQHRIERAQKFLRADGEFNKYFCSRPETLNAIDMVDSCLANMVEIINSYEVIIGQTRVLADYRSEYFDVDALYEKMNITRQKFRNDADELAGKLEDVKSKVSEIRKYFVAATLELIKVKSEKKIAEAKESLINDCVENALDILDDSVKARLSKLSSQNVARLQIEKVTAGVLFQKMQDFSQSACIEVSKNTNSPNLKSAIQQFDREFGFFKKEMSL